MATLREILADQRASLETVLFKDTKHERTAILHRLETPVVLEARRSVEPGSHDMLLLVLAELMVRQLQDEEISPSEALQVIVMNGAEVGQLATDIAEMAGMRHAPGEDGGDDPTPFG